MDEDMSPRAPGSGDGTETPGLTSMTNLVRQDWAETAAPEAAAAEEGRREAEAPMDAAPEAGEEAVAATAREGSGVGRRSWRSRTEDTGTEEQEESSKSPTGVSSWGRGSLNPRFSPNAAVRGWRQTTSRRISEESDTEDTRDDLHLEMTENPLGMALLCRPPGMEIVRPAASEVREGRKSFENRAIAQGPLQEDSADAAAATDSKDDKDTTAMSVTMGASCFSPRHAPQLDSLEDLAKADPDAPARAPSEVPGVTEQLGSLANLVGDDERPWGDEPSLPGPPPILVEDEQTTSALGLALSMVPPALADDRDEGRAREGRRSFVERALLDAAGPEKAPSRTVG
jgi:hypothetical protein